MAVMLKVLPCSAALVFWSLLVSCSMDLTGSESSDVSGSSGSSPLSGDPGSPGSGGDGSAGVPDPLSPRNGHGTEGGSLDPANRHVIPDGRLVADGRALKVGDTAIHLRGVCWNPVAKGGVHPADLDFAAAAPQDILLMQAAGINVVRTYEPIADTAVLDSLHAAGIKVIMTVYSWGGADPSAVLSPVNAVKDHPAVLMWMVGNEWNYNGLYVNRSFDESLATVQAAAVLIQAADPHHLVATAYGELPSEETIAKLSAVDVWGINSYRGLSFGDLFSTWESRSGLPMFLSEYGADAYDARNGGAENLDAQAEATSTLAGELEAHAARSGGVASGGTIFEWSDEWWKDGEGDPSVQDVGGIAPGGGPYPDATFNEEWWGIVTIDRTPRPAYFALQEMFLTP